MLGPVVISNDYDSSKRLHTLSDLRAARIGVRPNTLVKHVTGDGIVSISSKHQQEEERDSMPCRRQAQAPFDIEPESIGYARGLRVQTATSET